MPLLVVPREPLLVCCGGVGTSTWAGSSKLTWGPDGLLGLLQQDVHFPFVTWFMSLNEFVLSCCFLSLSFVRARYVLIYIKCPQSLQCSDSVKETFTQHK